MKKIRRQLESGSAVLISILILAAIFTAAMGAGDLLLSGLTAVRTQTYSTKAYFAAETGAERALYEIRTNFFDPESVCDASNQYVEFGTPISTCDASVHEYALGDGLSYGVTIASTVPSVILRSTGGYKDVKRTVEVVY